MLEVDETLMTIWLWRSSEVTVKVRRWPQSPIGTIFYLLHQELLYHKIIIIRIFGCTEYHITLCQGK